MENCISQNLSKVLNEGPDCSICHTRPGCRGWIAAPTGWG